MATHTKNATPEQLFALLNQLGIAHHTVSHAPVFTAHDVIDWQAVAPGLHCKNLFVEDKSGARWLITMPALQRASMNAIAQQLGSGRLSFCKPQTMQAILGVTPGSATPFALLNATPQTVTLALDESVAAASSINVHPLHNAASTILSGADLLKFARHLCFEPRFIKTALPASATEGTQVFAEPAAI